MNIRLARAIQQLLLAGATVLVASGADAGLGVQVPPPGPGQVPDYFGVTPNYATSPQPILTEVVIRDTGQGGGATAAATVTNGAITAITAGANGFGYVNPEVIITDVLGTGAIAVAGTDFIPLGAVATLSSPLAADGISPLPAGSYSLTNTSGTLASFTIDNVGTISLISRGSNYADGTVNVIDANSAQVGSATITTGTGTLTSFTLQAAGTGYGANATAVVTDRAQPNIPSVQLSVIVDASGGVTNITPPATALTGYIDPSIVIQDQGGTGATATATVQTATINGKQVNGAITGYSVTAPGSGYHASTKIDIVDRGPTGGIVGTGAQAVATTYDYANGAATDHIVDLQVLAGGTGYTAATTVDIVGFKNHYTAADVTPLIDGGVIKGFTINAKGTGYDVPKPGTGIRKFVDSLPNLGLPGSSPNNLGQSLTIATPTVINEPNGKQSDYYEIAEVEYTQHMHSDLPATHLRGYVQLDSAGNAIGKPQYLGPIIVAQKNRAVRVKLVNRLSTGTAGNLPFPVDHTYMGSAGTTDTDNRTAMHLHGGVTPWISDGLPRQWIKPAGETGPNRGESARDVPDMWFDANGNAITSCFGQPSCSGATNSPGPGALTYYYTNEQSARLMFYHDHAEGITRLNVYAGLAAGFVLQDAKEQAMVASGVLPPLADTIPLVLQEKTFVPDKTTPVLNFYGPFRSQLESQDPTWRWGSSVPASGQNGTGDLWAPHVYMTNQNPGDPSGANAVGRWDYGPWFWPPFAGLINKPIANPYYDPNCNAQTGTGVVNAALGTCEPPTIPGFPNGANLVYTDVNGKKNPMGEPSGTPEAFNDTPVVNGTVYPHIDVQPKKYRLRFLSVGNDRTLNLSLVVAASKTTDSTEKTNFGTTNSAVLCDGASGHTDLGKADGADAECTEVKMVPWNATQDKTSHFPSWWYTKLNGGGAAVTFDGREGGVFDPATRGPAMVQIGTEGGFLSNPVVIRNQPINYEYNVKNILVGSVKEHALLLGPAERADVIVDFSQFAGSTIILYNDAPAALPAGDARLDYFTGDPDNTDTGGAFSTLPGYGPNSRTLVQFRVGPCSGGPSCSSNRPPDYVDPNFVAVDASNTATSGTLVDAVHDAFRTAQEPIIVPQHAYDAVYGTTTTDASGSNLSRISDSELTFSPFVLDTNGQVTASGSVGTTGNKTFIFQPKSIIEDFTVDYGRMNAMLGVEIPRTTATVQTSIPQGYIDPITELVKISPNSEPISGIMPDGTQIWKITHNGVDTHPVHFHLFSVQLVNRVGWDGAIYPPEPNELGWKEVVRMNPLEDVIVALRPKTMTLPFKLGNSHRAQDPSNGSTAMNTNMSFNLDPTTGNGSNVTNIATNFGWEYVWHCHILGHEENDFMRSIGVAAQPEDPTAFRLTTVSNGVQLDWTDNSVVSNWATIQRDTVSTFNSPDLTEFDVAYSECTSQTGCPRTYVDKTAKALTPYYYRLVANNTVGAGNGRVEGGYNVDGTWASTLPPVTSLNGVAASLTPGFTGYGNVTASAKAVSATLALAPIVSVTPTSLSFGDQAINVASTALTVTVSNAATANGSLSFPSLASIIGVNALDFSIGTNNCGTGTSVAPGASCTISVSFKPAAAGAESASLAINTNDPANGTVTVALQGSGTAPPIGSFAPNTLSFADRLVGTTVPVTTLPVTLANTGSGSLVLSNFGVTGASFSLVSGGSCTNTTSLTAGNSCTINVGFKPTVAGSSTGTLSVTDNSSGVANTVQTVTLNGNGVAPLLPVLTASLSTTPPALTSLSWTPSSTVATQADTGYTVQRTAASTNTALNCATATYATLSTATTTSATDNTIAINRTYCYRVQATNAAGTFTSTGVRVTVPAAPNPPSNLTIGGFTPAIGPTGLTINWQTGTGTPAATGYEVAQCAGQTTAGNCTVWTTLGTTPSTSYAVSGLSAGTPYVFRVRAFNGPSPSGWLNSSVIGVPLAVADTATATANTQQTQVLSALVNVLTNDSPAWGFNSTRTVTNVSTVTHTGGPATNAATATVTCSQGGSCSLTLTSPTANNTTSLRQVSKRGTYTFSYSEQYISVYGNVTSQPVTVTVTVN